MDVYVLKTHSLGTPIHTSVVIFVLINFFSLLLFLLFFLTPQGVERSTRISMIKRRSKKIFYLKKQQHFTVGKTTNHLDVWEYLTIFYNIIFFIVNLIYFQTINFRRGYKSLFIYYYIKQLFIILISDYWYKLLPPCIIYWVQHIILSNIKYFY